MTWMDTGLLLKLYIPEPQTEALEIWLEAHPQHLPLLFSDFHGTELASALAGKQRRKEITADELNEVWRDIEADTAPRPLPVRLYRSLSQPLQLIRVGQKVEGSGPMEPVSRLRPVRLKWRKIFKRATAQALRHGAATGCRALDTLHVAAALEARAPLFLSSYQFTEKE